MLICIINYNSIEECVEFLKNLQKQHNCSKEEVEVLIINNGNDEKKVMDALIEEFRQYFKAINYKNTENYGFGAAVNQGMEFFNKQSNQNWFCISNTDVSLEKNFFKEVYAALANTKYDIYGVKVKEKKGTKEIIQYGTDGLNSFRGYKSVSIKTESKFVQKVEAVAGTLMFLSKDVTLNLKFDERYFMYVEENDFCYRANKARYKIGTILNAEIEHVSGSSFKDDKALPWYYKTRNLLLFSKKRRRNAFDRVFLAIYLVASITWRKREFKYTFQSMKGCVDHFRGKYGRC